VSGVASADGSLFTATGNTIGLTTWNGGEAILKLAAGPSFPGSPADFYAPADWKTLDDGDDDIGTSGAFPFDVGASHFVATMGKNGNLYLANRDNLGGIGGPALVQKVGAFIVTAPAVYATPSGTMIAFNPGGGLSAVKVAEGPVVTAAWSASVNGRGSAIATSTGSGAETTVWIAGAEGDGLLHAVNGETGEALFTSTQKMTVRRFNAPIAAKGRIYVAGDASAYAFTVR
jgi:outer membrane protein assembly factor BamB